MTKQNSLSEKQKASLEKARSIKAAKLAERKNPAPVLGQEISNEGLFESINAQFKELMKAIDDVKVQLLDLKSALPKKLDTSFLKKF